MNTRNNTAVLPLAIRLLAFSLFLPEELSFYVGTLRLTLTRVILLVLAPTVLFRLFKMCAAGRREILIADILVIITSIWTMSAVTIVVDLNEALAHTGPDVLEFFMSYFAMRVLLTDHGEALSLINLICLFIAIAALLALLDTATGQYFSHNLLALLTGYVKIRQYDYRYGLLRAASTFEHPIHLGVVCSLGLMLALGAPIRARLFKIIACGIGVIVAISSAPVLSTLIGIGLLAYDRMLAGFRFRWRVLIGAATVGLLGIYFGANAPISFISANLLFDPSSGWYREWEWTTAFNALSQSPWFGLAFTWSSIAQQVDLVNSLDSLWLYTAVTYGYPCAYLLGFSFIGAAFCRTSGAKINLTPAESKLGTALAIIMFLVIFLGFTVHLWASAWVFVSLLAGVKAHLGALGAGRYPVHVEAVRRRPRPMVSEDGFSVREA